MKSLGEIVKGASGDQSATASKILQEVMTNFSQKLSDLFGSQISDINRLNQETSVSIKQAMGEIQKLVSSLENSGQKAAEQMSEKMFAALEKMSAKQEAIDGQTAAFVNELKKIVTEGQVEAQQKMIDTMSAMSEQITKLTGRMGEEQTAIQEKSQTREKEMSDRAQNIVSGMTDSVKSAVEEIAKASVTMSDSVATLSRTTTSAIDRMNGGAELIANASQEFSEAGKSVSGVLNQSASLVERITSSSRSIENSTNALEESLRDYKLQRASISEMLSEIRNTVELAKKEAGLTADVLSKLDKATSQLGQAELAAEAYLANVSKVLAESHESFTREMNNSVNTSNREFHNNLKTAVDLLATTIGDLEASLGSVIGKKG
jgi:ABC-type transporter Mla subunit MlaD